MSAIRDCYSNFKFFQAVPPQIVDANVTGVTVDTQGYDAVAFVAALGALSSITSASYWAMRLQHTDASALGLGASDFADCSALDMLGSSITGTSGIWLSIYSDTGFESAVFAVGYRGTKRYVRCMIEEKGNLSTAAMSVDAHLCCASDWPVNANN